MTRSASLFLGLLAIANLLRALLDGGADENSVWVDLRWIAGPLDVVILAAAGWLLTAHALSPVARGLRHLLTRVVVLLLAVAVARDLFVFTTLAHRSGFHPATPLPLSLLVLPVLIAVLVDLHRPFAPQPATPCRTVIGAALLALVFPVLHMGTFGTSDYRRPADAAVVFGARVYADGTPSASLADRVRTACDLYRDGQVDILLMSGGPGDGEIHEVDAMRALAVHLGVPEHAILLDREGLSTVETVRNTCRIAGQRGWGHLLGVSHAYHLPRVKMAFRREGSRAFTVPARDTVPPRVTARLVLREVAAYWAMWLGV